jgi:alpha-beta hydrolase superfamily lysophospholipase
VIIIKHFQCTWQTEDGLGIFAQGWVPEAQPKGVVGLIHGIGEHSGRYMSLARYLTSAGYVLLAFDQRGHGRSMGRRGHTPSYDALMQDIDDFINKTCHRYRELPCFIYGHSLGGNLALNYVLRREPNLAGVVVTGPWIKLAFEPSPFKVLLGKIFNRIWPTFSQKTDLDVKALSKDGNVISAYQQDQLVHDLITARFYIEVSQAGAWLLSNGFRFHLPLLIMQGSDDQIVNPKATKEFARGVTKNCTFKLWEGLMHEIHNEPEKEQVFRFLVSWLDSHLAGVVE